MKKAYSQWRSFRPTLETLEERRACSVNSLAPLPGIAANGAFAVSILRTAEESVSSTGASVLSVVEPEFSLPTIGIAPARIVTDVLNRVESTADSAIAPVLAPLISGSGLVPGLAAADGTSILHPILEPLLTLELPPAGVEFGEVLGQLSSTANGMLENQIGGNLSGDAILSAMPKSDAGIQFFWMSPTIETSGRSSSSEATLPPNQDASESVALSPAPIAKPTARTPLLAEAGEAVAIVGLKPDTEAAAEQLRRVDDGANGNEIASIRETSTPAVSADQLGMLVGTGVLGLAVLSDALEAFLAELTVVSRNLSSWLSRVGPLPFLLMALAVLASLREYVRWRLRMVQQVSLTPLGLPIS